MITSLGILSLLMVKGLGRKSVRLILDRSSGHPDNTEDLYEVLLRAGRTGLGTRIPSRRELAIARARAERALSAAHQLRIQVLSIAADDYPDRLRGIPDPPVLVFVKGGPLSLTRETAIAVIGTRDASELGLRLSREYAGHMASTGVAVVSGLAAGCDTAAHLGCIEKGGPTVAVLAHGLDMVYPKANSGLAEKIVFHGGCLVSEYPPGTQPGRGHFVERDRLQSGLSDGVLLIQSGLKGGSMHTVQFSLEQARPLATVRPPVELPPDIYEGNLQLIKSGQAFPIENNSDLDAFLEEARRRAVERRSTEKGGRPDEGTASTQLNLFDP